MTEHEQYFYAGRLMKQIREQAQAYAVCHECNRVFYDDVPCAGPIACPFCQQGCCVTRGLTRPQADKYVHVPICEW